MRAGVATGIDPNQGEGRWFTVVAVGLSTFMAMLDMTAVAMALPVITDDFDTTPAIAGWVVLAYVVPLVGLSLPAGSWTDAVGNRRAIVLAALGFGGASLMVGLAPSMLWVVLARALQGTFAGLLFAAGPAVATASVPPRQRGRAMGVIATVGPLGAITGYAIGGVVLDLLGWTWIFYLNLPVSALVVAMILRPRPLEGRLGLPGRALVLEAVLLSTAALLLLVGLTLASTSGPVRVATVALAAVPFMLWWRSPAGHRLRALMQVPDLRGSHLSLLAETTALGMGMYLFPFYLQDVQGAATPQAGLVLLTLPAGAMIGSPVGGFVVDAIGPRPVVRASAIGLALALAVTAPLSGSWTALDVSWRLALIGASAGFFAGANQTMSMSAAPAGNLGSVGASSSMTRQLGFAFAPAFATAIWASVGYSVGGMRVVVIAAALLAGLAVLATRRPAAGATHPRSTTT